MLTLSYLLTLYLHTSNQCCGSVFTESAFFVESGSPEPDPVVFLMTKNSTLGKMLILILKNCTVADVNDVHTIKSRTLIIYSLKELAHFGSKLLVDFFHIQYT